MESNNLFLQLVSDVAEDGELTYQEIRSLAQWLNDNRHSRSEWPANEFYPLLKTAFEDGKIEKSEARAIGILIQKVLREWARIKAEPKTTTRESILQASLESFDESKPLLPSIGITTQISSLSESDMSYEVDFSGPYCSCPDFRSKRSKFPSGNLARCCKHIMQGYSELRPKMGWPSWMEPFLEKGYRPNPSQLWEVIKVGSVTALVSSASPTWGNVYARIDGESCKFGYSIEEDRWAYGDAPENPNDFVKAILKLSNA